MTAQKTWFITGASRGFGREWTTAALGRGDRVTATARDVSTLDDLVEKFGESIFALRLDVNDRKAVDSAVQRANEHFARLDVVVNNAGAGQYGMIEEVTEDDVRALFDTNVFGALWVTQAVLPVLREQGHGHILQVSSAGGIVAFPNVGIYNATKWTLEGISEALAQEVADFGIKVTLIEPGWFATGWDPTAKRAKSNPVYDDYKARYAEERKSRIAEPGDPAASAAALFAVVDAEEPPLRVFFGNLPLGIARARYESRLAEWAKWQHIAELAQG